MAPRNVIPKIELSADEQNRLVEQLIEDAALAEEFKSGNWDTAHDTHWRLYRAEPDFVERNFPWPGSSNLFIPIGQVIIEAFISQVFDAMASNDPPMNVLGMSDAKEEDATALRDYYGNYLYEQVIPFKAIFNDWLLNTCVDGTAAVKPRWSRVVRRQAPARGRGDSRRREAHRRDGWGVAAGGNTGARGIAGAGVRAG